VKMCTNWESVPLPLGALHKKSWAVIDRPYSLGFATVGALYERPRYISCAKLIRGRNGEISNDCKFQQISNTLGSSRLLW